MIRRTLILAVAAFAAFTLDARAQSGGTWIGFEAGSPTGITLMFDRGSEADLEFLAAWDLGDWFYVSGHMLFLANESADPPLSLKYGPGIFVGARDKDAGSKASIGGSFRLEGAYHWDQFAAYLVLTPGLEVIEETDFVMGGGIGFRMRL